ncbi:SidA/IucD/PvdA family monooxygenase [Crossiella cryophila]|uniref:L-lysine N6-monooxygenase MbtG n=1 Tax=Crossiella cryophila TaxID=43355 RepID=A0A7W7CEP7_9PSEU|nr:SidA/IucD/PvdA family monooxygenase [Crossiella cryophila]MBB4678423.1 L-ornithine N5-oxygenase [Crossiella cryophila]
MSETVVDVLGIGFGPGGIALAAALAEEAPELSCRFLEARAEPAWQPGMLLSGSDTQHHPSRDLATLRNPRSRYTFLNYLHETGRLLDFLNVPTQFPLRKDYARYVRWVAEQLSAVVAYNSRVSAIETDGEHYLVTTTGGQTHRGRSLVYGTGRTPHIPEVFAPHLGPQVCHSNDYQWRITEARTRLGRPLTVAVIGASQSAAEIALDLHSGSQDRVLAVMRSFGYRQKDHSPFSEQAYFPEFTDYYFHAGKTGKARLDQQLRPSNYSTVDLDVLEALYVRRYEDSIDGQTRLELHGNNEITAVSRDDSGVRLSLHEVNTGADTVLSADLVVLGTGFRDLGPAEHQERHPALLAPIAPALATDEDGVLLVQRDYRVPGEVPPLFLNGLCEHSHGLGDAGSFSLLSLRARTLLEGIRQAVADRVPATTAW